MSMHGEAQAHSTVSLTLLLNAEADSFADPPPQFLQKARELASLRPFIKVLKCVRFVLGRAGIWVRWLQLSRLSLFVVSWL